MKIRELRTTAKPKLMIIPMIDIIFFLLVFFMMSMLSMVVQKSMPVQLPVAQTAKLDLGKKLPVTITADGVIYVEKEVIPLELLSRRLEVEKASGHDVTVIIRADKKATYERFIVVLDTLKKAGISKISIATDEK